MLIECSGRGGGLKSGVSFLLTSKPPLGFSVRISRNKEQPSMCICVLYIKCTLLVL